MSDGPEMSWIQAARRTDWAGLYDVFLKLLRSYEAIIKDRDEVRAELEKDKYALEQTNNGRPSEWAYSILRKDLDAERAKSAKLVEALCDLYNEKFENSIRWPGDSFNNFLSAHKETLEKALAEYSKEESGK